MKKRIYAIHESTGSKDWRRSHDGGEYAFATTTYFSRVGRELHRRHWTSAEFSFSRETGNFSPEQESPAWKRRASRLARLEEAGRVSHGWVDYCPWCKKVLQGQYCPCQEGIDRKRW